MEIEKIIYQTCRNITNVEDKVSVSSLFLFCYGKSSSLFAELLYTSSHIDFIENLNLKYSDYDINFSVRLEKEDINEAFLDTLGKVKEKYDENGFYKALYDGDEFAIAIEGIISKYVEWTE